MKIQRKASKLNIRRETIAQLGFVTAGALPPTTSIQPTCWSVANCITDTCECNTRRIHTCLVAP